TFGVVMLFAEIVMREYTKKNVHFVELIVVFEPITKQHNLFL
mgnify:CR=1